MNRDKSLEFLQNYFDKINTLTDEEVAIYKEKYDLNCKDEVNNSAFEFISPSND